MKDESSILPTKLTVIGHFDCGCGQAAQPASLEIVVCASRAEANEVTMRMKEHATGHQCRMEPAQAVVILTGEPEIVHEVRQLPEPYLLFSDVTQYRQAHDLSRLSLTERARVVAAPEARLEQ